MSNQRWVSEVKSFEVSSGNLRVTDPCYEMDVWCAGTLSKVPNGVWHAQVSFYKDEGEVEQRIRFEKDYYELRVKTLKESGVRDDSAYFDLERGWYEKKVEEIKNSPGRIAQLRIAFNAADLEKPLDLSTMQNSKIDVGVDSGQAGFFDLQEYENLFTFEIDGEVAHEEFYDRVCEAVNPFGALGFGVASLTGYGDGGYDCYTRRDEAGNLLEAVIVFIGDDDEDDEEEGEE